jgi:hypothetical protein
VTPAANIGLLQSFSALTGSVVVAKLGTELLLFLAGYLLQRHVVFAEPRCQRPGKGCLSAGHG